MNLSEITPHIKEGKKVRRKSWNKDLGSAFLQLKEKDPGVPKELTLFSLATSNYPMDFSIMLSDDWIVICPEDEVPDCSFYDMLDGLRKGSKARLPKWKEQWIEYDSQSKQIVLKHFAESFYMPDLSTFTAEDWEVIDE
jgi:hypothetical protein